jgi:hypothetical protein
MFTISELVVPGILALVWLGVMAYLLVLATRLVRAIERISDSFSAH